MPSKMKLLKPKDLKKKKKMWRRKSLKDFDKKKFSHFCFFKGNINRSEKRMRIKKK